MSFATHNLAGQISAERVDSLNPNLYRITLTTYTDPAPANVDRCSASLEIWSVGANRTKLTTLDSIPRANGAPMTIPPSDCTIDNPLNGVVVKSTVKRNIYIVEWTFPGPGEYDIYYFDIARHGAVVNIDKPEEQSFFVQTRLFITPPIVGGNNTLLLLNEPLEDACMDRLWTHNPGGFDADGDSLVYSLEPSFQYDPTQSTQPQVATGYRWPDDPSFGQSTFTIDSITGLITWDVPRQEGIYNFGYRVEEYRNGQLLGYVVRDLAVWVHKCDNNPPVVESIRDTCVFAGDVLNFDFLAYDPDVSDSVYLQLNNGSQGNNGPFSVENSATINGLVVDPRPGFSFVYNSLPVSTLNNGEEPVDTITGQIIWETTCDNIRKRFYQVDFYATDNKSYSATNTGTRTLAANHATTIRVIPPPPDTLIASKNSRGISLSWDPTPCGEFVLGYKIYRQLDGSGWAQDTICCEMSPADAGFELIGETDGWLKTDWTDSLVNISGNLGDEICYAVTAVYAEPIQPLLPALETCAAQACVEFENKEIYLTNDSVSITDVALGEIFLSWSQPSVDSFFPPPYTYRLYRANNNGFPAIEVARLDFGDTTYTDLGLDTEFRGYNYRVELFDGLNLLINTSDGTNVGSSIFLTAMGGGSNYIDLEWKEYVPWANSMYEIYRSEAGAAFILIETLAGTGANVHNFRDENLNPEVEYCYFIRSYGSHNVLNIKDPIINDSQVACDFAQDDEPPCPPSLLAEGDCESGLHTIKLTKPILGCDADADSIAIYFANNPNGPYRVVLSLPYEAFGADTTFTLNYEQYGLDLAGCYSITAVDTLGNVSELALPSCVDYCPFLVMSNIFSPNQDGINDILKPERYRDVILNSIQIYDRWGRIMFSKDGGDIANLWDGNDYKSNKPAPEGVYYYYLRYTELGLGGDSRREERGWVTLLR
ncbi:MAG: gliding motility-associated C-terminal domain-containing protein [Bacteroidota bacterium]